MKSKSLIVKDMSSKELSVRVDGLMKITNSLLKNKNTALTKALHDAKLYLQIGHTGSIESIAITPDGKKIVSGSRDSTIKLWDIESGEELKTLYGHTGAINSIAITPDGKKIVSGSRDSTIKLWDIESGEELKTLYGHTGAIYSVAITPDGKTIVSGSYDWTIKLWDIESGEELKTLYGHTSAIDSIAITPDGKTIVSGSWNGTIKLWDIESGEELKTLYGHTGAIDSIAITPDGKTIVFRLKHWDYIKLYDIKSGEELKTLQSHNGCKLIIATMSNGKIVAFEHMNETISLWDIESKKDIKTYDGCIGGAINSIAITPDCKKIVLGRLDGVIGIWNIQSKKVSHCKYPRYSKSIPIKSDYKITTYKDNMNIAKPQSKKELTIFDSYTCEVTAIAITPDGKKIVSGSYDGTIKLWNIESGEKIKTLYGREQQASRCGHYNSVESIIISPDGKTIVSGFDYRIIKLWDIQSGEEKRKYNVDMHFDIPMIDISPDGKLLVHSMDNSKIKILNMKNGKLIRTINTDGGWSGLIISSDGKTIISSNGGTIKLWDMASGEKLKTLSQYNCGTSVLAITPDGKILVSRDENGAIVLCDIVSEKKIKKFQGYTYWVDSVAITPDSKTIVVRFRYCDYIKLYDIKSGEELKILQHTGVESIAITPDGKTIVSGSMDRTIKLWDIESGEELATFVSFGKDGWASITPDGYYNSSKGGLQYIKFLDKDGSFLPKEHEIYNQRKRKKLIKIKGL